MQTITPLAVADFLAKTQKVAYKFEVYDGAAWMDLCAVGSSPLLPGWLYRKRIDLPAPTVNLTGFPVKVPIVADMDIGASCLGSGYDIRFTAADGVTLLKYERESWSGGGGAPVTAIFWVKSDVATAGTYIWLCYGNPSAADGADPENVWDANFKAVYHMKDATTSTILDSTANNDTGNKRAANEPIEADGKIGKGQDFDGSDDYITSVPPVLNLTNITLEAWIKPETLATTKTIVQVGDWAGGNGTWRIDILADGRLAADFWTDGNAISAVGLITTGDWHHVVITFDGVTKLAFHQGGQVATATSGATAVNLSKAFIGSLMSGTYYLDGLIDEVRISSIARSAAWIAYEYANMNPADGGLTWGAEEPLSENYVKSLSLNPSGSGPTAEIVAGTWSAKIANPDGIFHPFHPTSEYADLFRIGREARISVGAKYGGAKYYWPRLMGYMDAPSFDHEAKTVSVSGLDRMKRLTDAILSSLNNHWGASQTFSSDESVEVLGSELYNPSDAMDIDSEANNVTDWSVLVNASIASVADDQGGDIGAYNAEITKTAGFMFGHVSRDSVCSVTAGKTYKVSFWHKKATLSCKIYESGTYNIMGQITGLTSGDWGSTTFYFTATKTGSIRVTFRLDRPNTDAATARVDYISIREITSYTNTRYNMPDACNGPYLATLNGVALWYGDTNPPQGWLYDEVNKVFYFSDGYYVAAGTNNLVVYYYTDQNLDDVLADLLANGPNDVGGGAGLYANRAAALAAMNYTPTGLTIPRVWFEPSATILAAIKLICERADYRFWFDEIGTPCFQPNPSVTPPAPPAGDVYYVDQTGGLDTNDGLSALTAWKTVAKVNAATLAQDDQVLFKRGETWAEEFKPTSSGASGHPIMFGAYGVGVPPKITGATRTIDSNSQDYITIRDIIFSGKEALATGSTSFILDYCIIRDSTTNGFKCLDSTAFLVNCLVIGSKLDGVLSDGAGSVAELKNTFVIANGGGVSGETYGGGGLNTANGGVINYSYSNITGNGYKPDWNIIAGTGGSNNQPQVSPEMERPMKDAAFFTLTIDDTDYAYAQAAAAAIAPYGGKLTFFVIPSLFDAAGQAALAALAAAGHEIAVHSWSHADLTATLAFDITSANTNPTIDVDVPTTTITLWCDESGNRVTFSWSGDKTIGDLKTAVSGKGWTITNKSAIQDTLRLACLFDSSGAQGVPYSTVLDNISPNYAFWDQEVNAARDWITGITGVEPKTMSYPYGSQNAALQAWLKAEGYEGARGTDRIPQTLNIVDIYNNRNGYDIASDAGLTDEAAVKAVVNHYWELCRQTARMLCLYVHNTGELSPTEWGWIAKELDSLGATLQTFGSYVASIRASHATDGAGLIYTKTYPDVFNPRLKPSSPCINVGFSVGLDEDIEGTPSPQAGTYDIGPYEFLMATPATPTFEDKDLKGVRVYQDVGAIRNRVIIEGIEQSMYKPKEDIRSSRLKGEASDTNSIAAYLEKTYHITNHLFQDQDSIDAACAALLAEWKDPKYYAEFELFANPIPLELGDTIGIKLLLQKVGEIEYYADRAVIIRDVSLDGSKASYKVEIIP